MAPNELTIVLDPEDGERLANLCGPMDQNLRTLELRLGVELRNRGALFSIRGPERDRERAAEYLRALYQRTAETVLDQAQLHLILPELSDAAADAAQDGTDVIIRTKRGLIRGRGTNQARYLSAIKRFDINFGVGPAGTGKTYLAVACAVDALEQNRVQRLILVRPAVEAGERLGFLPGDLTQKVDPYLRPLYDALYEMQGVEKVARLIERNVIEVAPLAFMRGRTLNDAFVILDEAQNTTVEQMKMFLTRIGFGSTAVITGDVTQIDLPKTTLSGLKHSIKVLHGVEGISFTYFEAQDVVRHPLVQRIVRAYAAHEAQAIRAGG